GVRRVPRSELVDRIIAGAELVALLRPVGQLLMQRQMPLDDADHFIARRMHLPARPRLLEAIEAGQPALVEVVAVPLHIAIVPVHPGELRLRDGARAAAEVDRKVEERLGGHRSIGAQAAWSHAKSSPSSCGPILAST